MSEKKTHQRYILLDVIRTVAIVLLISGHIFQTIGSPAGDFFGIKNFYYVSIGGLAVTIFLILSGISLELNHGQKEIQYGHFLIGRILRIYPIYLLSLMVGFVFYLFYNNFQCVGCSVFDIFASLTGTYAFFGQWGGPFVATSWFIGLIMVLYLFYPFISKLMKTKPNLTIFSLLVISGGTRYILGHYNILPERPLDWFPLSRLFEFGFGVYLVNILKNDFWKKMNGLKTFAPLFLEISKISFPLFLIHFPLLKLIRTFYNYAGLNLAIILYLLICIFLSWLILFLNKEIIAKIDTAKK